MPLLSQGREEGQLRLLQPHLSRRGGQQGTDPYGDPLRPCHLRKRCGLLPRLARAGSLTISRQLPTSSLVRGDIRQSVLASSAYTRLCRIRQRASSTTNIGECSVPSSARKYRTQFIVHQRGRRSTRQLRGAGHDCGERAAPLARHEAQVHAGRHGPGEALWRHNVLPMQYHQDVLRLDCLREEHGLGQVGASFILDNI